MSALGKSRRVTGHRESPLCQNKRTWAGEEKREVLDRRWRMPR
jgi:hypothetical protein